VYTEGTGVVSDEQIARYVAEVFELRPLQEKTAAYACFGPEEPGFTPEATDKIAVLCDPAGLKSPPARGGARFAAVPGNRLRAAPRLDVRPWVIQPHPSKGLP